LGVHDFSHPADGHARILCWNNRNFPNMRYRLSGLTRWGEHLENRSGTVSAFSALLPGESGVKWFKVRGTDPSDFSEEELPLKSCKLALDYCDLLRLDFNWEV